LFEALREVRIGAEQFEIVLDAQTLVQQLADEPQFDQHFLQQPARLVVDLKPARLGDLCLPRELNGIGNDHPLAIDKGLIGRTRYLRNVNTGLDRSLDYRNLDNGVGHVVVPVVLKSAAPL
jgi:hypothetical protein